MALARLDHERSRLPRRLEDARGRGHRPPEEGDVVAQSLPEAAGIDEVALEVDHHARRRPWLELEWVRAALTLTTGS